MGEYGLILPEKSRENENDFTCANPKNPETLATGACAFRNGTW